jgi:hypothetical protein
MKQTISLLALALALGHVMALVSSFSPLYYSYQLPSSKKSALSMVSRHEYLRPQFHVASSASSTTMSTTATATTATATTATATATSSVDMERVQLCADNGSCGLEEMSQLLQDLEGLSSECSSSSFSSPNPNIECTVGQVSTREWYMDELGYQIERSLHKADEEKHLHQVDLTQHLRRMHEIAEYEER